ncbi:MAG: hypothetical protein KDD49_13195 [Bacteroidetes bacterium]|nr:hypothetical protein [Bacteroidota bacterium]MCB9044458.1 hypothetical protein [Chitinophagales bacterium]
MSVQHISQSATSLAVCRCGSCQLGSLVAVSPFAHQRRVRRRFFSWSPSAGCRVYSLACGCFLWVYSSGQRFVSSLPF